MVFTNPEAQSKDKLKAELKKHGVSFAPNKPKDYYVQLYREKILLERPARHRSELSSDEEFVSQKIGSRSPGRHYSKVVSVEHYTKQLSGYSDSELAKELKKHGVSSGPITVTTRNLYEKKLARVLVDKAKEPIVSQSSSGVTVAAESDEDFSSDNEKETVDAPPPRMYSHQKSKKPPSLVASTPAQTYNLRPRPQPSQPTPRPPSTQVTDPKPPAKPTAPPPSAAPIRPYSATWCHIRLILNFLVLIVVFLVAVIGLDYLLYDKSRVVDWFILKYPSLAQYINYH